MREFKNCVENFYSVQIGKRTASFTLWTDRGAARHAKSLNTDSAWDMYELLEETFFRVGRPEPVKSTPAPAPCSKRTDPERKALTAIINTWVGLAPIHYASARAQVNAHFGVASVDALTVAQVKEAIQYVQGKIDALPPAPALPPAALPEAERPPLYRDGMFHLPRINPQHVPGPREAALHELWGNWWKLEENARTAFDAMLHELADCRGDLFTHAMSDMGRNAETFFNPDAMTEGFLCPYHAAETAFRQALHLARVHLKMALNAAVMLHR